jgi:hypothetical protein
MRTFGRREYYTNERDPLVGSSSSAPGILLAATMSAVWGRYDSLTATPASPDGHCCVGPDREEHPFCRDLHKSDSARSLRRSNQPQPIFVGREFVVSSKDSGSLGYICRPHSAVIYRMSRAAESPSPLYHRFTGRRGKRAPAARSMQPRCRDREGARESSSTSTTVHRGSNLWGGSCVIGLFIGEDRHRGTSSTAPARGREQAAE